MKIFFRAKICNCLNCDYNCDDHISISSVCCSSGQLDFTSHSLDELAATNIWVFIAQLGERCSANAEAMGSNAVEALKTLFGLKFAIA